jgi:hypothetical protein
MRYNSSGRPANEHHAFEHESLLQASISLNSKKYSLKPRSKKAAKANQNGQLLHNRRQFEAECSVTLETERAAIFLEIPNISEMKKS